MNQKKLSFKSENLVVDWIGLNISGQVTRKQVERIAKYLLQNFGFKPTLSLGPDGKKETLFYNHENEHQVYFTIYKDYKTRRLLQIANVKVYLILRKNLGYFFTNFCR